MTFNIPNQGERAALPLILLGAGGHAKVLVSLVGALGRHFAGVCDPALAAAGLREWRGLPVLGDDSALERHGPDAFEIVLGLGPIPQSTKRTQLFEMLIDKGYRIPALAHPDALIDSTTVIEEGAQIMAGSIIQPDCTIGRNAVVNTRASIDHDSEIGDHSHIAPGAVLCGGVKVRESAFIGASATLLPMVVVGVHGLVAAGSTLARSLADGEIYCPHRHAENANQAILGTD